MTSVKTLGQLTEDDLVRHVAWVVVGGYEAEYLELSPVQLDSTGRIPGNTGEVWCLCTAVFANETEHVACAMCRGDSADGPLLWSVSNGKESVPLLLPPAPDFVLAREGPEAFAEKFGMRLEDVFPLTIRAVPRFVVEP